MDRPQRYWWETVGPGVWTAVRPRAPVSQPPRFRRAPVGGGWLGGHGVPRGFTMSRLSGLALVRSAPQPLSASGGVEALVAGPLVGGESSMSWAVVCPSGGAEWLAAVASAVCWLSSV